MDCTGGLIGYCVIVLNEHACCPKINSLSQLPTETSWLLTSRLIEEFLWKRVSITFVTSFISCVNFFRVSRKLVDSINFLKE